MATDLQAWATAQLQALTAAAAPTRDEFAAAQELMDSRHPDPGSVSRADWAAEFGAIQHEQLARAALLDVRAQEVAVRARIAGIANPAEAQTHEADLRRLLVQEAGLRLELRFAQERKARAASLKSSLGELAARVRAELAAADTRLAWAEQHTALATSLRTALTTPPLSTVPADAAALRGSATFTAAGDRLDGLLPAELRARAEARAAESAALLAAAVDADDALRVEADTHAVEARPDEGAVAVAERLLLEAEAALAAYQSAAPGRLAAAAAALAAVAAYPALSARQRAALAVDADRTTAVERETALATSVADLTAAQQVVDDTVVAVRIADPDADPDADQDVIDARAILDDPALQTAVTDARSNYTQAQRDFMDLWEVEVPPDLWVAVEDFTEAKRSLDELAAATTVSQLSDALDEAEDAVVKALDAHGRWVRSGWALAVESANRTAARVAATDLAATRRRQYVQGDGPSGRLPAEL